MGMTTKVQENGLGLSVFGTAQVDYSVGAENNLTYDQVVARMGLCRATAVESAIAPYTEVLKARQRKAEDLGNALANIAAGLAQHKSDESIDKTMNVGGETYTLLSRYGLATHGLASNGDINFGELQKLQTDIQYALDVNNNDIQQDSATLQGLVQKRDNAYSMATKLMKKANQTRTTGIRYIG